MYKQSRNWCFTDFENLNWKEKFNDKLITYICFGNEICPTTGKKHIQGWLQFTKKVRLSRVKKILNCKKLHLETCKGSESQNDKYCQKENSYTKIGEFETQGQRKDLIHIAELISKGSKIEEIADQFPSQFIRYHRGFEKLVQIHLKTISPRWRALECHLLTGPTGCGKTRTAVEYSDDYYKIQGSELQWFDGYEGQKTLIIDEYSNDVKITRLLNLLDGYQLRLPVKGGFTYAQWTRVYITTNLRKLHELARDEHRLALKRRITETHDYWI